MTSRAYRLARGGPSPQARLPWERKHWEGFDVYRLVVGGHLTFREAASRTGMSTSTAWRRYWWFQDAVVYPDLRPDLPRDHVPPQRGTRECPRGEPPILDRLVRPRIRHPLPAVPCRAHRRRDGAPCGRWAIRGATVCPAHGGDAPQVRRAAAERVRQAEEIDRALRARLRHPDLRVQDLRARVLAKRRPWFP